VSCPGLSLSLSRSLSRVGGGAAALGLGAVCRGIGASAASVHLRHRCICGIGACLLSMRASARVVDAGVILRRSLCGGLEVSVRVVHLGVIGAGV
jgi:hypothetical protein